MYHLYNMKRFYLLQYSNIKYGQKPITFSTYCIMALITWKIQKNPIGSYTPAHGAGSTSPAVSPLHLPYPNKPIASGSCAMFGTMGAKAHPRNMGRRQLITEKFYSQQEKKLPSGDR